ncbi:putative 40S ribosomal protein S19-A [Monocercomonoides exilis]|uniref:putative 40S ribosomal protein S19-A n=1 Tax=Monocercomonoides exilis TaxID=2049356 RepID=UPI00355AB1AB|nr:putative 40S ribosomal protein S19-A [Monocercomonoides exilis]|eukprot:MONOS_10402.1-p1 / transcript=MONOS_10402.1 / gene=MONOS_10402 / organism=Monocercomonoides_exilis_PA203 / gene_product=40S ribosomal protein S19-A / transcript_product=40S ribosomal protein S19-A / location=Mono_scaffold00472:43737-44369(+) / protein_length=153 / sequence_SO=supercontig / SO=protein_coding / is_pseudo=false
MDGFHQKRASITVKDVPADKFIKTLAKHFKNTGAVEMPAWGDYCKTASLKELAPIDPDWYFIRAASIARKIYIRQGTGVGALKDVYGCTVDRGTMPCHHGTASGKIIRLIIHQLEKAKLLEPVPGKFGGRRVTQQGRESLDRIACQVVSKKKH